MLVRALSASGGGGGSKNYSVVTNHGGWTYAISKNDEILEWWGIATAKTYEDENIKLTYVANSASVTILVKKNATKEEVISRAFVEGTVSANTTITKNYADLPIYFYF